MYLWSINKFLGDKQNEIDSSEDECTIGFNASFDRALEGIEADVKRPTGMYNIF